MNDDLIIRMSSECGQIKIETESDGVISYKEISEKTLVNCLVGSIKQPGYISGLLPENCISFSVNTDGERSVCILHPAHRADIYYHNTCYKDFPLPQIVFKFNLHQGLRVNEVNVSIADSVRLTPNTKMFKWPFSNVSGTRMCIGNNAMPVCESLHTLASLPYHILSIPNNDDHYKSSGNMLNMEYRKLLEHLKDKDPSYYYEKILVPNGKVLSDFTGTAA